MSESKRHSWTVSYPGAPLVLWAVEMVGAEVIPRLTLTAGESVVVLPVERCPIDVRAEVLRLRSERDEALRIAQSYDDRSQDTQSEDFELADLKARIAAREGRSQ